ncbi:helix-turn-helix domain-containing protein [Ruminococcaceae bacterium OttesenSCG-928-L11]|nr:helix-turn-helix domain-containing protein [Ruminococcaceae bacterium OttesenSCG-928-L11]
MAIISSKIRYQTPFTMIDRAVLMNEELTVYDKTIYAILCSYANYEDGSCFPSYKTIARKAGCSRRKAIATVAKLVELGLLEKREQFNSVGDNTSNLYFIRTMSDASGSPPGSANPTPPDASCSLPDADGTLKQDSNNEIQSNDNHPSILREERLMEWKRKIDYAYFAEEMPSKLTFVDSLLGYLYELEQEGQPETDRLLATVDELVILEFLDEIRDKKFGHVKNFRQYLKRVFIEFLRQREIMLATI